MLHFFKDHLIQLENYWILVTLKPWNTINPVYETVKSILYLQTLICCYNKINIFLKTVPSNNTKSEENFTSFKEYKF